MRQITKADEIVGRTIKGAQLRDWGMILSFGYGDFILIEPERGAYDDGIELGFEGEPNNTTLRDVGVINQDEYDVLENARMAENRERIKAQDMSMLQRLMKKYPESRNEDAAETSS